MSFRDAAVGNFVFQNALDIRADGFFIYVIPFLKIPFKTARSYATCVAETVPYFSESLTNRF